MKGENMNQENKNQGERVLGRVGARELTPQEIDHVTGGVHTETVCSFNWQTHTADGDVLLGEC
jgi:hypothetical protein